MSRHEYSAFKRALALLALFWGIAASVTNIFAATTWTVNSTADTDDGSCAAALCTLRDAMTAAQNGDTIVFSSLFNSPQTIALGSALPPIGADLTITGPGASLLTVRANDGGNYSILFTAFGNVAISGLTLANGNASFGGAIQNYLATLALTNTVLTGNHAGIYGGAILNTGLLNISSSTLSGNSAQFGGAIYNGGQPGLAGVVTLSNTTLTGNSATDGGSAIDDRNVQGPAVPVVSLVNCTVADNTETAAIAANDEGGGATITVKNTIFANNAATFLTAGPNAQIVSQGNNLDSGSGEGFLTASGDLINTDPRLMALGYYGGQTPTYMPQLSSPAVNAGSNSGAPAVDQRGVPRPQGGVVDIGAVELRPLVVVSAADPGSGSCDSSCTLRDALTQANGDDAVADDIFFSDAVFNTPQTIGLFAALPNIARDVTINGPGPDLLTVRPGGAGSFVVMNVNSGVVAAISGMAIVGGTANFGAGITNAGRLSLFRTTLTNNHAFVEGGAIYSNGPVLLVDSTIYGNYAGSCSAMVAVAGGVVKNSTIARNIAVNYGTICNFNEGNSPVTMTLNNSTIARNTQASASNGAVTTLSVIGTTTTSIQNTIIADNAGGPELSQIGMDTHTVSLGNNLCSDAGGGFLVAAGDLINTEPRLGTLSNYGGPTLTLYPKPGSPAIDAGNDSAAPAADQRGVSRPQGVHVDIGAVEANGDLIFQDGFDG